MGNLLCYLYFSKPFQLDFGSNDGNMSWLMQVYVVYIGFYSSKCVMTIS